LAPSLIFLLLAAPALRLARMPGRAERSVAAFFLATAFGLSLRLAAMADGVTDTPFEYLLNTLGHVGLSAACIALFVFTRTVFRPTERWAQQLQRFGVLASLASLAGLSLDGGFGGAQSEQATSVLVANAIRTASYSWCFIESLLYWRMMRRRVALGLAEPIVANRFGLWCVWTGGLMSCLGLVLLGRIAGAAMGVGLEAAPNAMIVVRAVLLTGIVATMSAIWLSFFPPARYLDWIERRSIV
jgi:hypothetical protein